MQAYSLSEMVKIFILSVVQGITEWLPVSSTGHMIILEDLMPLDLRPEFRETFLVLVQLGSIMAVLVLYFNKLNPFAASKSSQERRNTWILWFKVAFASIPIGIAGLLIKDYVDYYLYNPLVVAIALIVYGLAFIWIERREKGRHAHRIDRLEDLTFADALKIGFFQALSLVPGTSRSGSTIIGGLLNGTSRYVATEFSFFLGIPAMFGASLVKLVDLEVAFSAVEWVYMIFGMLVAFLVSLIVIRYLISYIQRNDFTSFGYYRIILGVLVIIYFFFIR